MIDIEVLEHLGVLDKVGEPTSLAANQDEQAAPQPTTISSGGFYGNQIPPHQQIQPKSPPAYAAGGRRGGGTIHPIFPVEALTPYANKWTVKARCTHKSEIKHWHNKNGEGKLFSVNLLDDTGEIRATGFNEQCDQLYELFQENMVYYISSPCKVQLAKKQFTNLNNDYELTFERDTTVEKVSAGACWDPDASLTRGVSCRPRTKTAYRKSDSTSRP